MEPAGSLKQFTAHPVGKSWRGERFVYWCAAPNLYGFALAGRPTADDLERLCSALVVELEASAKPHGSLVDASAVTEVDPAAFEVLQRYVKKHGRSRTAPSTTSPLPFSLATSNNSAPTSLASTRTNGVLPVPGAP